MNDKMMPWGQHVNKGLEKTTTIRLNTHGMYGYLNSQ